MRDSLNIISQRKSKVCGRSSLCTDEHRIPSVNASSEPLPPIASGVSRIKHDLLRISSPVPGTFIDICDDRNPSRAVLPSMETKRKPNEMPLSCHPPFGKSWIELQPLQIHVSGQESHLRVDRKCSNSDSQRLQDAVTLKQSPGATTNRPYHGITLPPPPLVLQTRQCRERSHSKPRVATCQSTTPIDLFEQPIAPLTLHRRKNTNPCPMQSPHLSGAGPIQTGFTPTENFKLFAELNDELDKVINAYTAGETA